MISAEIYITSYNMPKYLVNNDPSLPTWFQELRHVEKIMSIKEEIADKNLWHEEILKRTYGKNIGSLCAMFEYWCRFHLYEKSVGSIH
ncbi:unnamed protein product [Wuchereria bancrofti]|uniref:Uncharacterized protein n=1 Tax=Wuchereria bancrofti TaxID=6293 RepID=A0A3P7EFG3_WUCBA|nr:unnamed protein product [Wuchereria bancrofti]